jgi:hypothetical protein
MTVALCRICMIALKLILFSLTFWFGLRTCFRKSGQESLLADGGENLLGEIILIMHTGTSFEGAMVLVGQRSQEAADLLKALDGDDFARSDHSEVVKVLRFCRENSSVSYRLLHSLRQVLRLRRRLHGRQRSITLQARAQAIVSGAIYVLLLFTQWQLNPEFQKYMATRDGRMGLSASFLLVAAGLFVVTELARPGEMEI